MKVSVKDSKSGLVKDMAPRFAKVLVAIGRATYFTRDLAATPAQVLQTKSTSADDLLGERDIETMDQAQLHAYALELGLTLHPLTGEKKVRAAIVAHRAKAK